MELAKYLIDIFLHLDKYISVIIASYGTWTYLLLFLIIFCETGLVVTPFLPGDSLLFAIGAISAIDTLDVKVLFIVLSVAAILGDSVNYAIGHRLGTKVFHADARFFKRKHLDRTQKFYEKYGGKTIILARFIPIIRTFAPFIAGIGVMSYTRFIAFNVIGALLWIGGFVFAGYFFGNIPTIKHNFTIVIMVIVIISVLPGFIEYLRHKKQAG
ncbi:DedA family protein [bacterium]|nr:MAG: DedA family protein [bacterium]